MSYTTRSQAARHEVERIRQRLESLYFKMEDGCIEDDTARNEGGALDPKARDYVSAKDKVAEASELLNEALSILERKPAKV